MVNIIKEKISNQEYFYLEHSYRKDGKVKKIKKYLGKKTPKNVDEIKKEFMTEFYKEKWFNKFDTIKKNYKKELKNIPKSAKLKDTDNFAIKFTYNTNKIEGSTLTYRETASLLEYGISPTRKPISDIKEAESHKNLFLEILQYNKDLSLNIILTWHKELLKSTKKDIAGKIRRHQVKIAGSKFIPPLVVELNFLLKDFFKWYNKEKNKIHPIELAALVHLKFVTIHPFSDGNGRMSRLMMNFILNKHGFPLLDIEYANRNSYYNALERSQTKEDNSIFLNWFFKKYLKEYKSYLD